MSRNARRHGAGASQLCLRSGGQPHQSHIRWQYDDVHLHSLDQLTSASTSTQSASYSYDGRGNLTSEVVSETSGTQSYSLPVVANGVVYMGCVSTLAAFHLPGTTPYDGWMRRRNITWGMDARAWTHMLGAGSDLSRLGQPPHRGAPAGM